MEFRKIAVIGAGLMGHGIAEVMALNGYETNLNDVSSEYLTKGKENIEKSLARMQSGGKISAEDAAATMGRIHFSPDLKASVSDVDLVIEAIPEVLDLKKNVITEIESASKPETILASNTSNFRITQLQEASTRPDKIVGMHFFNPPVVLKLVEVVKGAKTDDAVFDSIYELCRKIGKTPIKVLKDSPGFVVNRITAPSSLLNCLFLDNNLDSYDAIDRFARNQGLPMGPYELMDYVGVDTVVHSLEYYSKELSPEYGKCKAFVALMDQNKLGRKTGQGFYTWKDGKAQIPEGPPSDKVEIMDVLAVELNEAIKLIEDGVASPDDIETGVRLGMNRPFGPISVAQGLTNAEVKTKLNDLAQKFDCTIFSPAKSIEEGRMLDAISGKAKPVEESKQEPAESPQPSEDTTSSEPPTEEKPEESGGDELVTLVKKGAVAKISLNNGRLNLLSADVLKALNRKLHEVNRDKEVFVVIVSGKGEVFSAGAELSQFFAGGIDFMQSSRQGHSVFKLLSELRKITIAEIKGYALGGGLELSLACDIRVSTPDAKIGFPELSRGLVPGWGGTQRMTKLIGASRAAYLILTSDRITGTDAEKIGLVSKLFEKDKIEEETFALAESLSKKVAPGAAYLAKLLINKGSDMALDDGLTMESISMGLLYSTEDLREGVSAFLQKRDPEFKGK